MTASPNRVEIQRYSDSLKSLWDRFVPTAKNTSFLFLRDYMDYHRDRFIDHSLLFRLNGRLLACLPANAAGSILHSHQGLTFGGLLLHRDIRLHQAHTIVAALRGYLLAQGLEAMIYRPMPHPYHEIPAEEDILALQANGATPVDVRAGVFLRAGPSLRLSSNRRRDLRADSAGEFTIRRSDDFSGFMGHCTGFLARRFASRPIHSPEEIVLLASRFPDNIQLYVIERASELLAGTILYRHGTCAKLQYGARGAGPEEEGTFTRLYGYILHDVLPAGSWLDFGHSHDPAGRFNEGVHRFKESMGARTIAQTTYRLAAGQ